jgi:hypothetical protein
MMRRCLFALLIGSFLLTTSAFADAAVFRVSAGAPGPTRDGLSWSTAFLKVQDAVNTAAAGDEVWVATGVYNEAVTMKEAVSLYGGFTGTETAREERHAAHETVLDAQLLWKSVVTFPAGVTDATVLDGFIVQNGTGTVVGSAIYGAGIYCRDASPVISGNIVTANRTSLPNNLRLTGYGGGLYCGGTAAPLVRANIFRANQAIGAAIYADTGATPEIVENEITGNKASGAIALSGASGSIRANTIRGNATTGITITSSSPTIAGNLIADHEIKGDGAGISCLGGDPVITNNTFRNNRALDRGDIVFDPSLASHGGAIFCNVLRIPFPPPAKTVPSNPTISGNVFLGNAATYGAAVALYGGTATLANNTIAANGSYYCGGVYLNTPTGVASSWTLANNLVAFNGGYGIYRVGNGAVTLRSNDLFGNGGSAFGSPDYYSVPPGPTDISVDPLMPGLANGNPHIAPDSPCVDAGNDADAANLAMDMDGQPRIQGARVDIGADESDGLPVDVTVRVVRVSPSGDDTHDGSSWAAAKRTVQAGINAVADGGEVWVAEGVYTGPLAAGSFVRLHGGFGGTETERDARDWAAHPTVLDGNAAGTVVTLANSARYNVVDGFTIRNGKGIVAGAVYAPGTAAPVIAHNRIVHNTATLTEPSRPNSYYDASGGVYAGGAATIRGNTFFDNTVIRGATAVYAGAKATVTGNTIVANAGGALGSIYLYNGGVIANNIVAFNSMGLTQTGATLKNNCIFGNAAFDYYYAYGEWNPTGTDGNISADPKFAAWRLGNLHLQPDSPCVDAGNDAYAAAGNRDLDGQPRIQGARVDIGADESDATVWNVPALVVRVSPIGDDANDGSSWERAKKTIGAALAAARGGEVWAAQGEYVESPTVGSLVRLYGGFRGTETDAAERAPSQYRTVLRWPTPPPSQLPTTVLRVSDNVLFTLVSGLTIRDSGTAISVGSAGFAEITGNDIAGNATGIALGGRTYTRITDNTIRWNGRGVWAPGTDPSGKIIVTRNRITENNGLGVEVYGGTPTVTLNVIRGNAGGGVRFDGFDTTDVLTLAGNVIAGNAGGVRLMGEAQIVGNTIVHNRASSDNPFWPAAGIYLDGAVPQQVIIGNIIAFNSSGVSQNEYSGGSAVFRNNDVFGNTDYNFRITADPTNTNGNIRKDPLFADVAHGDFHIQPTSPCRNAGDAATVVTQTDINGLPRVQGGRVDIGADESDGSARPATPAPVFVRPDGDDASDGGTWTTAKRTVSAAVDMLNGTSGGRVWVAAGTYGGALHTSSYVDLLGGFAGTESAPGDRDGSAGASVLDAQRTGSVIHMRGLSPTGLVDGFTLTNGSGELLPDSSYVYGTYGGALFLETAGPVIRHNIITNNQSNNCSGVWALGPAVITGNIFRNNPAGTGFDRATLVAYAIGLRVEGNVFTGDTAGAMQIVGRANTVTRNTVTDGGRGLAFRGTGRIDNNLLARNMAGIVVENHDSDLTIANNTIADSQMEGLSFGFWDSHTVQNDPGSPLVMNNIVAFNGGDGVSRWQDSISTPVFRNNDVYGNPASFSRLTDPTGTDGNISTDPLFVDRSRANYRLLPGSLARDAGDDSVALAGAVDLDGALRIQGAHVDMGAYEAAPAPGPADAIAALRVAAGFQTPTPDNQTRLNVVDAGVSEGVVDLLDAVQLLHLAMDANP